MAPYLKKVNDMNSTDQQKPANRLSRVKHTVMVLSGKGGVGKSTVAANLAAALAGAGKQVGLLDIDIHGPSIPKLFGLDKLQPPDPETALHPVPAGPRLVIMSIALLLTNADEAIIWRGPMKYKVIKQFLEDVEWGPLDYLIVDSPPGTGDEPLSIAQLVESPDGAVIVTTPQALAIQDVRRSIKFCQRLELPILGVVENMSGFCCPECGAEVPIFRTGGGAAMAKDMDVPFLGAIPIETDVVTSGDCGVPIVQSHPESKAAKAFERIAKRVLPQASP